MKRAGVMADFISENATAIAIAAVVVLFGCAVVLLAIHQRQAFTEGCRVRGGHVLDQGHGYRKSRLCVSSDGRLIEVS